MPKKRRSRKQDGKEIEALIRLSWATFIVPVFRLSVSLITGKTPKEYRYRRLLFLDILGIVALIAILALLASMFGHMNSIFVKVAFGIVGLLLLSVVIAWLRKRSRRKYEAGDISKRLEQALRNMDSIAKWYDDENEANRELVSNLRMLKVDAEYGYKLPNGRIADARIGSGLIEGKLSPDTAEVDRLLGQLGEYTPYGDKLHIVIYGKLSNDARRRIENEISTRYLSKVFLITLSNPKRLRVEVEKN